jgi:hypothetical protein
MGFESRASTSYIGILSFQPGPQDLLCCFSDFSDRVSQFSHGCLRLWSSHGCLPCSYNYRNIQPGKVIDWHVGVINFFPRLVSNHGPPHLLLLSRWDYRHEPPQQPSRKWAIFAQQFYPWCHSEQRLQKLSPLFCIKSGSVTSVSSILPYFTKSFLSDTRQCLL